MLLVTRDKKGMGVELVKTGRQKEKRKNRSRDAGKTEKVPCENSCNLEGGGIKLNA